jgi:hypothetical protein
MSVWLVALVCHQKLSLILAEYVERIVSLVEQHLAFFLFLSFFKFSQFLLILLGVHFKLRRFLWYDFKRLLFLLAFLRPTLHFPRPSSLNLSFSTSNHSDKLAEPKRLKVYLIFLKLG